MYGTKFSDIHCGMRGITLDGFKRIRMTSQSWEYASEMVLKSVHLGLRTDEVPVSFLKDADGRVSHLVRGGWFTPWKAGWINLKAMFVFGADLLLGLVPLCGLFFGRITIAGLTLDVNSMLFSLLSSLLGLQLVLIGALAQTLYDGVGRKRERWLSIFSYTRTTVTMAALFAVGSVFLIRFIVAFFEHGSFDKILIESNHQAIFGLFLMVGSVLVFISMLLINAIALYVPIKSNRGRK
jgi:hypothetical protein